MKNQDVSTSNIVKMLDLDARLIERAMTKEIELNYSDLRRIRHWMQIASTRFEDIQRVAQ